jgi:sugar-specific transcriptional regulator TrmB
MDRLDYDDAIETFKKIGLGNNEAKIYFTLIKLGPCMAGRIAKESNIDRSACYDSLKALLKKGLIKYVIEANIKKYSANSPQRIIDFLKEKEEMIEKILPQLNNLYKEESERAQVLMYKGYRGIRSVFLDILKDAKGKENLVIDSSGLFTKKMPFFAPHFVKGLEKNKVQVRQLVKRSKELYPSKTTKMKYYSESFKDTIVTTNIYGNKIAIILWTDVPEAIVIKNKSAADSYKDYFEILWKQAKN